MSYKGKCKEPNKYYIHYKNNPKKYLKKCNEISLVEEEENLECLPFYKFKIISI